MEKPVVNFSFVLLHKTYWPIYGRKVIVLKCARRLILSERMAREGERRHGEGRHRPWNSKRLWFVWSHFHRKSQSGFSRFKQKNILMKYLSTKVLLLENSYSFSTKKMKEVRVNVVLSGVGEHMGMTWVNTHNRTNKAGARNSKHFCYFSQKMHSKCGIVPWEFVQYISAV